MTLLRCAALAISACALLAPALAGAQRSGERISLGPSHGGGAFVWQDGRLVLDTRQPLDEMAVQIFRPENVLAPAAGAPRFDASAFSPEVLFRRAEGARRFNSAALCSPTRGEVPFRCDAAGARDPSGTSACYDLFLFRTEAHEACGAGTDPCPDHLRFYRSRIFVRVADPRTPAARVASVEVTEPDSPLLTDAGAMIHSFDLSMTADGRMLVFGAGDVRYSVLSDAEAPCSLSGWSEPRSVTSMYADRGNGVERYALSAAPMTDALGQPMTRLVGAYPWVFPDGDDMLYMAQRPACQVGGPVGVSHRGQMSVVGLATRFTTQVIDGDVNPLRGNRTSPRYCNLTFFQSSPVLFRLPAIPAQPREETWPMFIGGGDYAEVSLDDALREDVLASWQMNELVVSGQNVLVDRAVPDATGRRMTMRLENGAVVPDVNLGPVGRVLHLGGGGARGVSAAATIEGVAVSGPPAFSARPAFTLETWLAVNESPRCAAPVVAARGADGRTALELAIDADLRPRALIAGASSDLSATAPRALAPGRFAHVAVVRDAGGIRVWVDGVPGETAAVPPGFAAIADGAEIAVGGGCLVGMVDEVRVHARALGADELCRRADRIDCTTQPPSIALGVEGTDLVIRVADPDGAADLELSTLHVRAEGSRAPAELLDPVLAAGAAIPNGRMLRAPLAALGVPEITVAVRDRAGNRAFASLDFAGAYTIATHLPTALLPAAAPEARGCDPALAAEGRRLFFEETFDGNGTTCGTCHDEADALALSPATVASRPASDPLFLAVEGDAEARRLLEACALLPVDLDLPASVTIDGGGSRARVYRAVPPIAGAADTGPYMHDGRHETLEAQAAAALDAHFGAHRPATPGELRAIAELERCLEPPPAPARPADAVARGRALFEGRALCAQCHAGPWLHRHRDAVGPVFRDVSPREAVASACRPPSLTLRFRTPGGGAEVVRTVTDPGRAAITGSLADLGKLDVPPLRGLAATGPYFHDHTAADLAAVLDRYDALFALDLTDAERADLIAFLESPGDAPPPPPPVSDAGPPLTADAAAPAPADAGAPMPRPRGRCSIAPGAPPRSVAPWLALAAVALLHRRRDAR
jgi:cytochrome c peroxidase